MQYLRTYVPLVVYLLNQMKYVQHQYHPQSIFQSSLSLRLSSEWEFPPLELLYAVFPSVSNAHHFAVPSVWSEAPPTLNPLQLSVLLPIDRAERCAIIQEMSECLT